MKFAKGVMSLFLAILLTMSSMNFEVADAEGGNEVDIIIDGSKAITQQNKTYKGNAMVSANNSSRLLLDYKAENEAAYWEILEHLFGESGVGITHLKIEMGSDVNSSSGTEPSVMRYEDEVCDVTRGAGFQLAADAKKINPDLTLDMLYWSEPLWITNSADVHAARYKWYKAILDKAYEVYGLEFDYVSANRNERRYDSEWIKYLSKALKSETDCPYDYSKIKIVAADEVGTWMIAHKMSTDEELRNSVDVIGSHYTSSSTNKAKEMVETYGKELWFSEGCSPMSYSQGTYRFDGNGSGLNDINGMLDIANRFVSMFPQGMMTLYEYQPAVASYYDGVTYAQKQLILANEPWSGYYLLDSGYYMSLHFSRFIKKGWAFVDGACYADGVAGGDGHAIVNAKYSYITTTDTETDDYTFTVTNTTAEPITYNFTVKNLGKAGNDVYVWETRGPDGKVWNENYFKKIDTIKPVKNSDGYTYSVTIKPYSLVSISTVDVKEKDFEEKESKVLSLPYEDDFEYKGYGEGFLSSRGNTPRFTTDQGGAFEVAEIGGNNVLMQMVTPEIKAEEWGYTPNPVTCFGDDRWYNYSISADVSFAEVDSTSDSYVGIGLRFTLGCNGASGYWIKLCKNGYWALMKNSEILIDGNADGLKTDTSNNLKIEAINDVIKAYLNGELLCEFNSKDNNKAVSCGGRASLYSSFDKNYFDSIKVEAVDSCENYISRYDNTDWAFDYSGSWEHNTMSSFTNYKRTISTGKDGASLTFKFNGNGFALTGVNDESGKISVKVDGEVIDDGYEFENVGSREVVYALSGLEKGEHTVDVSVISGSLSIDGCEVTGGEISLVELSDKNEKVDNSKKNTSENKKKILPVAIGGAVLATAIGIVCGVLISKKKKSKK